MKTINLQYLREIIQDNLSAGDNTENALKITIGFKHSMTLLQEIDKMISPFQKNREIGNSFDFLGQSIKISSDPNCIIKVEKIDKENKPTKTVQEVLEYCKEQRQSFGEERQKAGEIEGYNSVGFGMFDGHCEAYNNVINFIEGENE